MQKIKNVAVLGAGAMGAYFITRFIETPGITTQVIARGEHYERLKRDGLTVNGHPYVLPVVQPDEVETPADLVIVALKYHHLPEALPDLKKAVGDQTTIISVMNGLDSEEIIGEMYGMDKVLYAISVGIDALRQGSWVSYTQPGKHYIGEARNGDQPTERVQRVQQAFTQAGIPWQTPADMLRILWWKFMVNVGMNQASAVMRAPYGIFQTSPAAQRLMEALMQEVIELAGAQGIDLTGQDLADWYAILKRLSPDGKTSMLQDIEAGVKTEVEMFGVKAIQMGEEHNIPTPFNQAVVSIIQVLEEQAA